MIFDWRALHKATPCSHCGTTVKAGPALFLGLQVFCSQKCARAFAEKGKK